MGFLVLVQNPLGLAALQAVLFNHIVRPGLLERGPMRRLGVVVGPETAVAPVGEECAGLRYGGAFGGVQVL